MTDAAKPDDRADAELRGEHWIAGEASRGGGEAFHGVDPSSSEQLEPAYFDASEQELERAVTAAASAAPRLAAATGTRRTIPTAVFDARYFNNTNLPAAMRSAPCRR